MNVNKHIKKYVLPIFLISVVYLLYAYFVLAPSNYKYFSLIDDGQSIQNSQYINDCIVYNNCSNANEVFIEKQFGRFRPGYWMIQHFLYKSIDLDPIAHHQFRIYIVGYLSILFISLFVLQAGSGILAIFLSTAVFVTSYSFSENIIRLGPQEPYQILFIGIFSLIFLFRKAFLKKISYMYYYLLLLLLLLIAVSIKETSFVIALPPLLISLINPTTKKSRISL